MPSASQALASAPLPALPLPDRPLVVPLISGNRSPRRSGVGGLRLFHSSCAGRQAACSACNSHCNKHRTDQNLRAVWIVMTMTPFCRVHRLQG